MGSTSLAPLPVLQPERCCPVGNCAYTPSKVRAILLVRRVARERGEDAGELAASILGSKGDGRSPGASAGSDTNRYATLVADVDQAIQAIGGRPGAEAIADWICPYSGEVDEQS